MNEGRSDSHLLPSFAKRMMYTSASVKSFGASKISNCESSHYSSKWFYGQKLLIVVYSFEVVDFLSFTITILKN